MRTALINTVGFDEKFCYRAILRHGIKERDKVILITGKKVDRVVKACEWVQQLLRNSYGDQVEVEVIEINVDNVVGSIKTLKSKIEELEDFRVIVNLSGGMRAITVIVLLACLMSSKGVRLELETEDFETIVVLPEELLKLIKTPIGNDKVEVLRLISEGCNGVVEIANRLEKDPSTIRRHIAALEKMGLVKVEKRKPLVVGLTNLSELLL